MHTLEKYTQFTFGVLIHKLLVFMELVCYRSQFRCDIALPSEIISLKPA